MSELIQQLRQQRAAQAYGIKHYQFPGILRTDQWLILVLTSRGDGTLSLVELAKEGPRMRLQQGFPEQEVSLLTPLLEHFPEYCPYEVLLAHLYGTGTEIQIRHYQKEVIQALNADTLGTYLSPLRNILSRVRVKVRLFGVEISGIFETGYQLRPVADRLREQVQNDSDIS